MARGYMTSGAVLAAALLVGAPASAASPDVVASINPVHSLVASVMEGVGKPTLLLKGSGSPHAYSLRPSEARALNRAQVIFWIGDELETFLQKPLATLGDKAKQVALAEVPGITLLKTREGGIWEGHDDHGDEHGHDDHGGHDHEKHDHDEHGHEKHGHEKHDHDKGHADKHDDHAHGEHNMHVWLDPVNAKAMVTAIVAALSAADPTNTATYKKNGAATTARLDELDAALRRELAPVKAKPFIVFHDAYHYFEQRYGLTAAGSITVSPDRAPGAKRLFAIRKKILEANAACVFTEPQFQPKLVNTVVDGTPAKTAELDPLGAAISPGPNAYPTLLRNLASALRTCLSATN